MSYIYINNSFGWVIGVKKGDRMNEMRMIDESVTILYIGDMVCVHSCVHIYSLDKEDASYCQRINVSRRMNVWHVKVESYCR